MTLSVTVELDNPGQGLAEFERRIFAVSKAEGSDLVEFLERESPRGVSPASTALARNWNLTAAPETRRRDDLLVITNSVPNAMEKLAGAAPGRTPAFSAGSNLDRWVRGKLGITDAAQRRVATFRIAVSIGQRGTERYRTGQNILDIDPDTGELGRRSPVFDTVERIELGIEDIDISI